MSCTLTLVVDNDWRIMLGESKLPHVTSVKRKIRYRLISDVS